MDEIVHEAPLGLQRLSGRIKSLIARFEPRLERLSVVSQVIETEPLIQVEICAWRRTPPQRPLRFDFELRPSGRFFSR